MNANVQFEFRRNMRNFLKRSKCFALHEFGFPLTLCQHHAFTLINCAPAMSLYHKDTLSDKSLIMERGTIRWTANFMARHSIVVRWRTGSFSRSLESERKRKQYVSSLLRVPQRAFGHGVLAEYAFENGDATHCIFNTSSGRAVGFRGDSQVKKYADFIY